MDPMSDHREHAERYLGYLQAFSLARDPNQSTFRSLVCCWLAYDDGRPGVFLDNKTPGDGGPPYGVPSQVTCRSRCHRQR